LVLGRRIQGILQPIDVSLPAFRSSTPGQIYEIHVRTVNLVREKEFLADMLISELNSRGARVIWLEVSDYEVKIQVIGSPFAWQIILALLPEIFMLVGVALVSISVFTVWAMVPGWVTGMMFVGLMFLGLGYLMWRF